MKYLSLLLFSAVVSGGNDVLPRIADGGSCKPPQGSGTCQSTSSCAGLSYAGYCPGPTDIQCCVATSCSPPGKTGVCQKTSKSCSSGSYIAGYCPGDSSIQCCSTSSAPANPCANPQRDTCSFYPSCLEAKYHCGANGYPLGYGLKYCNKFSVAPLSSRGRRWVSDTMLCLQRTLVPEATTVQSTCPAIKNKAYGSHPRCYVDSGVCKLPPEDWLVIVETVDLKDLFGSVQSLKTVLQTADGCADFYAWLIKQKIIKLIQEAEDVAKDVWHKITDWF